jgi:hypothetical protein
MTYRTSAHRDASPVPMPAALARAFDDQASRSLRVGVTRIAILVPIFGLAYWAHHWALWALFGIATFLQLLPAILVLAWVGPRARRLQRKLEKDASGIVWVHTEAEARSKLHRIELHDRVGDVETVFTNEALAQGGVEAMRALGVVVTKTAAERETVEPKMRLAGKIAKLDEASVAAEPPRLREQRANVEAFLAAWDARVERDGGAEVAAEIESRVDKALHYYNATRIGEPGRKRMRKLTHEKKLEAFESVFAPEHFTDDIAKLLVELNELATSPRAS